MLVLRHGISERTRDRRRGGPRAPIATRYDELLQREGVPFWPDAAWRDVVFGAATVATIVLLALDRRAAGAGRAARPEHPRGLSAARLVFPLVLRRARARAAASRDHHHRARAAAVRRVPAAGPASSTGASAASGAGPWAALLVVFIWTTIGSLLVRGRAGRLVARFLGQAAAGVGRAERPRPEVVEGARLFHAKGCEFCHADRGLRREARARPQRRAPAG